MKFLRKIVSVLVLLAMFVPTLQKTIHDFSHQHDFHCTSTSEKHFHEVSHHCVSCDVSLNIDSSCFDELISSNELSFLVVAFNIADCLNFQSEKITSYLRGPPLV
jgi:hypothetical protein